MTLRTFLGRTLWKYIEADWVEHAEEQRRSRAADCIYHWMRGLRTR